MSYGVVKKEVTMGNSCCAEADYSVKFDEQRVKALKHKPRSASSNRSHHPSAENGTSDVIAEIGVCDFLIAVSPQQQQSRDDSDRLHHNRLASPHQVKSYDVSRGKAFENDSALASPVAGQGSSVFSLRSLASEEVPTDNARNEPMLNPLQRQPSSTATNDDKIAKQECDT